ncbi:hypothetical protein PVAP13_2KG271690 [Panicum virgatum]|uniref:Uncharacterized protein n=1 Tax=Panicum virgatum TaxID=38727 RepID=A0A8T0W652_PANVG|nr:hypothetical protein PVAP13_2KG271690 [Panicum virgatum]
MLVHWHRIRSTPGWFISKVAAGVVRHQRSNRVTFSVDPNSGIIIASCWKVVVPGRYYGRKPFPELYRCRQRRCFTTSFCSEMLSWFHLQLLVDLWVKIPF